MARTEQQCDTGYFSKKIHEQSYFGQRSVTKKNMLIIAARIGPASAPIREAMLSKGVNTAARLERTTRPFALIASPARKFVQSTSGELSVAAIECDRWSESSRGDRLHKMILVVRGQIDVEGEAGGWLVVPNHMIFIPADRAFNLRTSDGMRAHVAFLAPDDHPWHHHGCWVTQANPLVHELLTLMLSLSDRAPDTAMTLRQLFRTLSHLCQEWFSNPKMLWLPVARSDEMRALIGYISTHLSDVTVASACAACHLAPRTMQRLSQEEFSFGLKSLIIEVRMMRAMELLAQDNMPIEAVAQSVGYASVSSFTTAFTNRAGHSPGEYRQRNRTALQSCGI
ncbi:MULTISPECIES: helix-turn-helix transcriptional regulator [unclassified Chelatococcus]|uniref:helix-turn-helix domain-containing protein n=1 Tax=unclassified Chelatococcus TaxID=2638111 RepID=UPI001BCEFA88|nr:MULTISPECIES: helix-turn-helix transcriptional regulator [unclassified Chelatococcus]MBS7741775.1 helix-turn-helix transcriptional regulator [Chelatococcus sp. HY11]MBX3541427.1 helix-turn-helix transcriptional regulator [Chelatococcus sp.]MCO5074679.1 helix-turn-helix transcriptional regulator [Chelatococcus sp.]